MDSGFRVPCLDERDYGIHEGYENDEWELRFTADEDNDTMTPKGLKRLVESCLTNNADMDIGWTVYILEELFIDTY